jgi:2-alkenal reductase
LKLNRPIVSAAVAALALVALIVGTVRATHPRALAAEFFGGSDQHRITAVVARDKPSVVAIEVTSQSGDSEMPDTSGSDDPNTEDPGQSSSGGEMRASGSGFVYDRSGLIVTNAHVVSPASGGTIDRVNVIFANGDRVPGTIFAVDRTADLALVHVANYANLPPPLPLGTSADVRAGQWAIAIGEPLELRDTVTVGVVSGFNRREPIGDEHGADVRNFAGLLQTSAPINPGNSGGPLIDLNGRVIGINQAVAGGAQNIGFAIPIDKVRSVVANLKEQPGEAPNASDADTDGDTSSS